MPGAFATRAARLGALDEGHVGVLETRATHLEVGHVRMPYHQLPDKRARVTRAGGVDMALAAGTPAHLGGGREVAGQSIGTAVRDNPPAIDIFMLTNPEKAINRAEKALIGGLQTLIAETPLEERVYAD